MCEFMGVNACVRGERADWERRISNSPFDLEKSKYEHAC